MLAARYDQWNDHRCEWSNPFRPNGGGFPRVGFALSSFSIGFNCALGADQLLPYIQELARKSPFHISAHPNAGLPNAFGEYDEGPDEMGEKIRPFLEMGLVNIIGGCCGTTRLHTSNEWTSSEKAPSFEILDPMPERKPLRLSGLEPLVVSAGSNFVNVGERCNVTGSRKFLRLINEGNYDMATEIARDQVENGAQILDVNMDEGMIDGVESMKTFLNLIMSEPDIARIPVMVDSSKWEIIEAGLQCLQGKSVVNSLSLKEGEQAFIEQATKVRNYGAAVIIMAFDENGQADSYQRRIEICERAYSILTQRVGMPPEDIIFDPNIFPVGTGMEEHRRNAIDFFRATQWIKEHLPHARVSGGVSNVSF